MQLKEIDSYVGLKAGTVVYYAYWFSPRSFAAYHYRRGSVPGIRKFRGGSGWLRRFGFVGNQRDHLRSGIEYVEGYPVRHRKGANLKDGLLLDPWEDYPRCKEKNWKSQRRTQYK